MVDHCKRLTLSRLAVLASGLVTGCCTTAPGIRLSSQSALSAPLSLAFKPNPQSLQLPYTRAIDSHAHFFNGTDLQTGGYFSGPLANQWANIDRYREVYELVRYLGTIIQEIVDSLAPSATDEWNYLDTLAQTSALSSPAATMLQLDKDIAEHSQRLSAEFYEAVKNTQFPEYYRRAARSSGLTTGLQTIEFGPETLYQSLNADYSALTSSTAFQAGQFAFDPRIVPSIMGFVARMFSRRLSNIRAYQREYTGNARSVKIVATTDVLVDFDYWLGDCDSALSAMRDQILLHERLRQVTQDYTIPILGFNPWKAAVDPDAYFALVEDALENRGFRGAKLYPPIGYFPDGSLGERELYRTRHRLPKQAELKAAMKRFYSLCDDLQVVVMAHGNHTMGERAAFREMAGPGAWKSVFSDINPNQRVNIGHFGGFHCRWTDEFIALMKTSPNLYGDIGYLEEILKPDVAENFISLIRQPVTADRTAVSRVLYGSDWFMLNMYPDWKNYLENMYLALQNAGATEAEVEQIFYLNASRLFNV